MVTRGEMNLNAARLSGLLDFHGARRANNSRETRNFLPPRIVEKLTVLKVSEIVTETEG